MNVLFLDAETTGVDPNKNVMVDLYAEFHVDGKKVSDWGQQFFHKACEVDLGALKVNGLKIASLYKLPDEAPAIASFVDYLLGLGKENIVICGLNVDFDKGFIKSAIDRYNVKGLDRVLSHRVLDISSVVIALIEAGKLPSDLLTSKGHSLQKIAKALDIPVDEKELHTAKGDTVLSAKVTYKLIEMLKGK